MPTRNPDIVTLITDRIHGLETNLTAQIHESKMDLGGRISELTARVSFQNGRVGKLEQCMAKLEAEVEADLAKPASFNKKQATIIGAGGIITGTALVEIIGKVGELLHSLGLLG